MNAMTYAPSSKDIIARERTKIINALRDSARCTGKGYGLVTGAHAQQAVTATAHTANKARVASTAFAGGFCQGFIEGWKG